MKETAVLFGIIKRTGDGASPVILKIGITPELTAETFSKPLRLFHVTETANVSLS
ncbi:MAG: hypothetical protein UHM16_01290 [Acutalibacteraceae bacterium]|nr:hypothetical protein [Acutalibacteraceae bacterium]